MVSVFILSHILWPHWPHANQQAGHLSAIPAIPAIPAMPRSLFCFSTRSKILGRQSQRLETSEPNRRQNNGIIPDNKKNMAKRFSLVKYAQI